MKVKPEHFRKLQAAIAPLDTTALRQNYKDGLFPGAEACKDLYLRYRWDLLYMSRLKIGDGVGIKGDVDIYGYANDDHLDTALRRIVPPL